MFKLSNGKEFSKLIINSFETTLGYITKSSSGKYSFKLVTCETMLHRLMLAGLSGSSSSNEIARWMRENLTVTLQRDRRSECYPSWCRTMEDEIYAINEFADCPARSWHYEY
jgi:hypothetical protein